MTTQNATAPAFIAIGFEPWGGLSASKKTFSTGSVGYYASGKVTIDGQVYQCSVNMTLVGSKPE